MHGSIGAEDTPLLSKRELEVMRKIAWGESTKEMADSMEIREVTVKQYVKTAIKKLGAQNRSHAVGELFRRGFIS
ncbi:response regulator transcription factor [Brevibacillus sp. SIMBA_040]|uniref:response regulator transcription factor n=1 Tax=unclassified Brevibacillus TaxID=2684853 RepID=UPI00397D2663